MIKINAEKIGLFTDIHWGKSRDNTKKLDIAMDFIEEFIKNMQENDVDTVVFLGDWFDHRNSVNVYTGFYAYSAIIKLCKHLKVYMIIGNHDTYFKNSTIVNSIQQYENIDNLTIISETTEVDINGKKALFCPWGFETDMYKNKEYDYLFGHFEPNGIQYNNSTNIITKGSKYSIVDLNELAPTVFAGHYHIRKLYHSSKGTLMSLGCPVELDWGDLGNEKGCHILDTQSNDLKFIPSNSPKHIKFSWSKIQSGGEKITEELVENNYIKIVIDCEYKYEDVYNILNETKTYNPIEVEPDFIFSINDNILIDIEEEKNAELKYNKIEYIVKYIEKMNESEGYTSDVSKENLIKKAKEYYQKVSYE